MESFDITYSSLTKKGGRKVNEDYLDILKNSRRMAFVLCDGLGGHGKGDVASRFVVSQMINSLDQGASIEDSIMSAQKALLKKQRDENAGDSMKTTLTCLTLTGRVAQYGHVGDSRIYYFENDNYKMRSQDHSVPQMLVNRGEIQEKDIRHHEDRGRLLWVMGSEWNGAKYQVVDNFLITRHSSFLLCSDGFWELIEEKMMCKTLKEARNPADWLSKMEEIILENGKGTNMDNYSAIAIFVR